MGSRSAWFTINGIEKPEKPNARVFFALWPDAAARAALSAWQAPLQQCYEGRAMRSDTLHVTLVFVGNVALERVEALKQAAREVRGEPFELVFTSARFWKHNHIVHAAPETVPQPLARLVSGLEKNLRTRNFQFDQRPYQPHITLLRNARWRDEPLPSLPQVGWNVQEFVLVQSVSTDQGVRYAVLERFALG